MSFYKRVGKQLLDRTIAAIALVVLAPLLALIAGLVRLNLGKPVLFVQTRPGLNAALFTLRKFRTMTNSVDERGNLLPNHLRLTRFGRFLRSSSLDELPELWNVVKGDMSLVGPRPLLTRYLGLYSQEQHRRHDVRPGLTGWAQVHGRNAISWREKFELDVWYVDNVSFLLDLKILWLTIYKVVQREGINAGEKVTMVPFDGTN